MKKQKLSTKIALLCAALLMFIGVTKMNALPFNVSFTVSMDHICSGGHIDVVNTSDTTMPGVIWQWYATGNSSPQNWIGRNVYQGFTFWNTNTYQVILEALDSNGVILDTYTKNIYVFPEPSWPNLSPNNLTLECGPVLITDNNNSNDVWTNAAGDTLGTGPSITISSPGTYYVLPVNAFGCVNQNPMNISIPQGQTSVNIGSGANGVSYSNDSVITSCQGNDVYLNASINTNTWGGGFVWENGSSAYNRTVTQSGYYSLIWTGSSGCTVTKSIHVILKPAPVDTIYAVGPTTVCGNVNVNLYTPQSFPSYSWNGWGQSPDSSFMCWNQQNVFVIVTDTNGCTGTSNTIQISVHQQPNQSNILENGCELQSDVANTGTWVNRWRKDTSNVIIGNTQMITPMASGIYINMIVDTVTGCYSSSIPHPYIAPALPIITGNTTICQGETAHLGIFNDTQYTGFIWSNGTTSSTNDVSVAGQVVLTTIQGNCLVSSSTTITVNPTPIGNISPSNPSFCEFGYATINAPTGSGYTYNWNTGQNVQSPAVFTSGYYSVTVTNSFGCSYVTPSVYVVMHPQPSQPIVYGPCQLATGSYYGYQWFMGDSLLVGETGQYCSASHVPSNYYSVQITDVNGCTNTSDPYLSDCGTGINEATTNIAEVYPNPFTNRLTVKYSDNKDHTVKVVDVLGKVVIEQKGHDEILLNTENLSSGLYFIPEFGKKLVKQ
ncbi:MAG: T9SS type A sorting domain-containing protein [Candidatus Nomurabacteria bacterium]|nr:T9SS type A sorting domain-containing protein [Candidatus Nomurabacteria bacterium]